MKTISAWLPVILWMGIIFIMSSRQRISVSQTYELNFLFFKTLHIIEYAFLYVLSYRALYMTTDIERKKISIAAFLLTVMYAVTDEIHQTFVPTREGHIRDVIIDAIGAGTAWIFLKHTLPILPKKLKKLAIHWHLI